MKPTRSLISFLRKQPTTTAFAVLFGLSGSLESAPIYWGSGGVANAWGTAGNWYTDAGETTVSGAAPTSTSDVIFNTTPDNTAGAAVNLSTVTSTANSLTFTTSGATTISQNGSTRSLILGGGGITVDATAGNSTLGVSSNALRTQILQDQTWTNNSATATLNVRTAVASEFATGPVVLTLNAASAGAITANLSYTDSNYTGSTDTDNTLGIVVDSAGSGAVNLVTSAYTGGTTLKRGLLNTSGTLGTGGIAVGLAAGTNDVRFNATGAVTNNITVGSGTGLRALTGSGSGDLQGSITLNRDVSIGSVSSSGQTFAISGDMSGSANVTIGRVATGTSNPTVTLSGDNTYSGKTTIESATLVVSSVNRVTGGTASSSIGAPTSAANGTITMSSVSASTLRYVGAGETTDRVIEMVNNLGATLDQSGAGVFKLEGNITMSGTGSRTLTLRGATAGSGEISGLIQNIGGGFNTGLTKLDAGTWRLSNAANTYTGGTTFGATGVAGGVIEVASLKNGGVASSIGASSNANSNLLFGGATAAGTLRYIGTGDSTDRRFQIGGIGANIESSGTGALNFTNSGSPTYTTSTAPGSLTLGGTNTDSNTLAGVLINPSSNVTSLTKSGVGSWTLTGNNTYTGTTSVNQGKLVINGNSSLATGDVSVAMGATLGGGGILGGATTVSGSVAPGNSIGTLTINNDVTWNANDAWVFELGSAASSLALAGSGTSIQDLLNLTGTGSDFIKGSGSTFTFDFANTGAAGFYKIVDWTGTSGFVAGDFVATNLAGGATGTFIVDSGTSALYLTVVPEPDIALLTGGFGVLALLRRRRGK